MEFSLEPASRNGATSIFSKAVHLRVTIVLAALYPALVPNTGAGLNLHLFSEADARIVQK